MIYARSERNDTRWTVKQMMDGEFNALKWLDQCPIDIKQVTQCLSFVFYCSVHFYEHISYLSRWERS